MCNIMYQFMILFHFYFSFYFLGKILHAFTIRENNHAYKAYFTYFVHSFKAGVHICSLLYQFALLCSYDYVQ